MLFNSYEYLFLFLPIAVVLFYFLQKRNANFAIMFLVLMSLFFYAWWDFKYIFLLLASILFNFVVGEILIKREKGFYRKPLFIFGIAFNIGLIGYFKYCDFFISNANVVFDQNYHLQYIILPLAISFFTFQQIAYLVDSYRHEVKERSFWRYCLFVSFFPQLIAGPIVHHKEMMPQFKENKFFGIPYDHLMIGLMILAMGLFKKAVIADGIAPFSTDVFGKADAGQAVSFLEAWQGTLAYTFQLYFDFSGYSDMAIGSARLFGIILPINFNSPYKRANIIDFWSSWHITLSRFLKDYVYIPLGGNRSGRARRHVNLMLTMLIGGLWHGASWNFVFWGALHGMYLMINHFWHHVSRLFNLPKLPYVLSWFITFLAVIVAWIFFRAETFAGALIMVKGLVSYQDIILPNIVKSMLPGLAKSLKSIGVQFDWIGGMNFIVAWVTITLTGIIAIFAPNSLQIMRNYNPTLLHNERTKELFDQFNGIYVLPGVHFSTLNMNRLSRALIAISLSWGILSIPKVSEFLYFQF